VRNATVGGETRFSEDAHTVSGEDGNRYWSLRTSEYNLRYLAAARRGGVPTANDSALERRAVQARNGVHGRAKRGSQRQLQDYVNERQDDLTKALLEALPIELRESVAAVRWVSPLANEDYAEYRDGDFLHAIDLGEFTRDLTGFWPALGPSWDGLAVLSTTDSHPVVILVEAKSHVPEIYGNGCQASATSRALIEKSLAASKQWCGAKEEADWTGPLYQSANRIAHLFFIRQRLNRPCFLLNLYLVADPYRPTAQAEWDKALQAVHQELGLSQPVPGLLEVFLPGKLVPDEKHDLTSVISSMAGGEPQSAVNHIVRSTTECTDSSKPSMQTTPAIFAAWRDHWQTLASFQGPHLPDPESRIEQVLAFWEQPIPGKWQRDRGWDTDKWKESPYRRRDLNAPRAGEHTMEREILINQRGKITLLGAELLDGVNALPLCCDFIGGARRGNVEADLLLLSHGADGYRLVLCEVKASSDDPWYAAVESLRQMRLFLSSPAAQSLMVERGSLPADAANVAVTGLAMAPAAYFSANGKKGNALAPARRLFERMRRHYDIDMRFAVWDAARSTIHEI